MPRGLRWYMRAPTYSALSSYRSLISLRSDGGAPSRGSFCTKSLMEGTRAQTASLRSPSMCGAEPETAVTCAVFSTTDSVGVTEDCARTAPVKATARISAQHDRRKRGIDCQLRVERDRVREPLKL